MRRRWGTTRAFLLLEIAMVDFIFVFRFLFSLFVDLQKRRYPLLCDMRFCILVYLPISTPIILRSATLRSNLLHEKVGSESNDGVECAAVDM